MRWIVLLTVAVAVLVTSAPLWAQTLAAVPIHASVLAVMDVVGDGVRGTPEHVKMAVLGAVLVTGSTRLRRRRGQPEGGD